MEEIINKKLVVFNGEFEKFQLELLMKVDALKEQVNISTSAMSEETTNRGAKGHGKKWPSNSQVSYAILMMTCHI